MDHLRALVDMEFDIMKSLGTFITVSGASGESAEAASDTAFSRLRQHKKVVVSELDHYLDEGIISEQEDPLN